MNNDEPMAPAKPARPPKPFRKPLPLRKYQQTLRRRVYLEPDRAFLDEITATSHDGMVSLSRSLTSDERKRLAKIAGEARKNRGAVRRGKLMILSAVVGAVVVFSFAFKDRLVEAQAERLLSAVFSARAEIDRLRFAPLAGLIRFDALRVADARSPMTNLFEIGSGALEIDTWQLVNRRVIIRDLTVSGLAAGTPRTTSGEPASSRTGQTATSLQPQSTGPDSNAVDRAADIFSSITAGVLEDLDPREFVEEHLALLETPRLVEALTADAVGLADRWQGRLAALTAEATQAAVELQAFARTDFTAIRTVDQAIELQEEATRLTGSVGDMTTSVETAYRELTAEAGRLARAAATVPAQIGADTQAVIAAIPDLRAEGRSYVSGVLENQLRGVLGEWYDRALFALEVVERLRDRDKDGAARSARRSGRIVEFTTRSYPGFLLEHGVVSATGAVEQQVVVKSVSSDPDLTGAPTTLSYARRTGGQELDLAAMLDPRPDAALRLGVQAKGVGAPVAVRDGLEALGLRSITAVTDLGFTLTRSPGGASSGEVELAARQVEPVVAADSGPVGPFVASVLERTPTVLADLAYAIDAGGSLRFTGGRTNLDGALAAVLQEELDRALSAFRARVEEELTALLEPRLELLAGALDGVIDVEVDARTLLEFARDREAAVAVLEARAVAVIDQLRGALEAEAQQRIDEARRLAEEELARREAEARAAAEEARRQAEAAARDAVQEQVDSLRDRIRLPGR